MTDALRLGSHGPTVFPAMCLFSVILKKYTTNLAIYLHQRYIVDINSYIREHNKSYAITLKNRFHL